MSNFTPINHFRSRCNICNLEVSKTLEYRHTDYHVLGDMALSPTDTLCPLCRTPISNKAKNFFSHLKGFHKLPENEAKRLSNIAKNEAKKGDSTLPKPSFSLPKNIQNQIQVASEQMEMKNDEKKIDDKVVRAHQQMKIGRPRIIPTLAGESEEQRKNRINRETVQRFRDRKRAEKGITGPKRPTQKQLKEGESVEEYDRRLKKEAMKRYRAKLKEKKAQ